MAVAPILAAGQINALDGEWTGRIACGELQVPSARSTKGFSADLALITSMGSMRGMRQNAQIVETYSGSVDRTGRVTVDASGHWKDDPSRAWRIRLQGNQSGSQMELHGPMESTDGKTRLRGCHLELGNSAMEQRVRSNSKPAPQVTKSSATAVSAAPPVREAVAPVAQKQPTEQLQITKTLEQKAAERAAEDAAAITAKARALELENARLQAEKLTSEKAAADKLSAEKRAADNKKAPIKARSTMDL